MSGTRRTRPVGRFATADLAGEGSAYVRWFLCKLEQLAIEIMHTTNDAARGELLDRFETTCQDLTDLLANEALRNRCPWGCTGACNPYCE